MAKSMNPTPSHMGIFVTDMERMVQFYSEVLGLTVTNRGEGTSKSDEKIVQATEAACRNDPGFMLRAEFVRRQSEIMSRTQ